MMEPLDLSVHYDRISDGGQKQQEKDELDDMIMTILTQEKDDVNVQMEEIFSLVHKQQQFTKNQLLLLLPHHVVAMKFVENRLNTFQRNVHFCADQVETLLEAIEDEEEDVSDVLKDFLKARIHTFQRNMVTIFSSPFFLIRRGRSSSGRHDLPMTRFD